MNNFLEYHVNASNNNLIPIDVKKYMEFEICEDIIKDKILVNPNSTDFEYYICSIDFAREINIFYGIKENDTQFEKIKDDNFNKYSIICRLLNWYKFDIGNKYRFRVLKSNKNEKVDFKEELEYFKSKM